MAAHHDTDGANRATFAVGSFKIIADMPTGWICGQTARDFIKTKTGRGDSMDIQEAEEFQTSKFFCMTDFNMEEIKKRKPTMPITPFPSFTTSLL